MLSFEIFVRGVKNGWTTFESIWAELFPIISCNHGLEIGELLFVSIIDIKLIDIDIVFVKAVQIYFLDLEIFARMIARIMEFVLMVNFFLNRIFLYNKNFQIFLTFIKIQSLFLVNRLLLTQL